MLGLKPVSLMRLIPRYHVGPCTPLSCVEMTSLAALTCLGEDVGVTRKSLQLVHASFVLLRLGLHYLPLDPLLNVLPRPSVPLIVSDRHAVSAEVARHGAKLRKLPVLATRVPFAP